MQSSSEQSKFSSCEDFGITDVCSFTGYCITQSLQLLQGHKSDTVGIVAPACMFVLALKMLQLGNPCNSPEKQHTIAPHSEHSCVVQVLFLAILERH